MTLHDKRNLLLFKSVFIIGGVITLVAKIKVSACTFITGDKEL